MRVSKKDDTDVIVQYDGSPESVEYMLLWGKDKVSYNDGKIEVVAFGGKFKCGPGCYFMKDEKGNILPFENEKDLISYLNDHFRKW